VLTENHGVQVQRATLDNTRITSLPLPPLADRSVRIHIRRFALTANNVSYALTGDSLGYWDFFPTEDREWGHVPCMGWGDVVESAHPEVEPGGRYFGWYPMSRYVDVAVERVDGGLRDIGTHRAQHDVMYRTYAESGVDPWYPRADNGQLGELEDRHALLRGLFLTGFLADEFFAEQDYMGAEMVVVLSASSKTAIGFAQRAAMRGIEVVGVTSEANAEFVEGLGWYDVVIGYDGIVSLKAVPAVVVDMSGNGSAVAALHERLGDRLRHSMVIGHSHHQAPLARIAGELRPRFFFAPSEATRCLQRWGRREYGRRTSDALAEFIRGSQRWLRIEHTAGALDAVATWDAVYHGRVPPSVGRIASLHDTEHV
jgi:hypothetical protein